MALGLSFKSPRKGNHDRPVDIQQRQPILLDVSTKPQIMRFISLEGRRSSIAHTIWSSHILSYSVLGLVVGTGIVVEAKSRLRRKQHSEYGKSVEKEAEERLPAARPL